MAHTSFTKEISMELATAHDKLLKYITDRVQISEAEAQIIKEKFHLRKLAKKDYFVSVGSTNFQQGYVVDGSLRVFYTDPKGNEHVMYFAFADWWVGDLAGFHFNEAATLSVQALEDSYILEVSKSDIEGMYLQVPALERLFRIMAQRTLAVLQKRFLLTISAHAEERYKELLQRHPGIEQLVAQHQIASYLGILPESLSRMKKKLYVSSPNKK
jgi:CRP/FNR family transcriptional regulator, anaerobic regulatory protein